MKFSQSLIILLGIIFVSVSAAAGQTIEPKTLTRFYDPIEIRAELFPSLHNLNLDHLCLLACHQGKLESITYQFDEWTPEGELILNLGEENNAAQANNQLDPQDMLVFMARDAGDRVAAAQWQSLSSRGLEIEIRDPLTQEQGWVYLLYFPQEIPAAERKYTLRIETETPEFRVYGDTFIEMGTSRKLGDVLYRTVINRVVAVTPAAGGNGENLIDRSKARFSLSLLFGFIKIKIDEDNIIGGTTKYYVGPVRGGGRQWLALVLPMHLKSPRIYADVYVYDTMIFTPVIVQFPFNPGYVLTNYSMSIGYDLYDPNARGMKYYSDTNPQGCFIDGRMDENELAFNESLDKWRCIVGPQGWMVHRSMWDEDYKNQAEIKLKYTDDVGRHEPPDYFPGDLGYYYTESTVESLEPRTYNMQLEWYWPYYLYTPEGPDLKIIDAICNIRDNPLLISVEDRQVKNRGALLTTMVSPKK